MDQSVSNERMANEIIILRRELELAREKNIWADKQLDESRAQISNLTEVNSTLHQKMDILQGELGNCNTRLFSITEKSKARETELYEASTRARNLIWDLIDRFQDIWIDFAAMTHAGGSIQDLRVSSVELYRRYQVKVA